MNAKSPIVVEISNRYTVPDALLRLQRLKGVMLLESSATHDPRGRYSFLMAEPIHESAIKHAAEASHQWNEFKQLFQQMRSAHISGLPPFQGGAAGLLSYEFGNLFEPISFTDHQGLGIPLAVLRIYPWVIAWDHWQHQCWFIGHDVVGLPLMNHQSIAETWDNIHRLLEVPISPDSPGEVTNRFPEIKLYELEELSKKCQRKIWSNFDSASYITAINQTIEYIKAGDIFQANITQQLFAEWEKSAVELYLNLRKCNPAPFAGYFDHQDFQIISASPERFIHLEDNIATTRPIKGTRRKLLSPEANLYQGQELAASSKDRAENVMIVDLLRNDFSRVCRPGTVKVPKLCEVETFSTVQHLVSEIKGELKPGKDFWDLLEVTLPGGSISGAPKIRARQIINELEQIQRGAYCGNLFYQSFSGLADSNVLIRTFTLKDGVLQFPVGGGIVVNSVPADEYQETLHKAAGMLAALSRGP